VVQAAVAAAVRVVADHPVVDSVVAVEAVEIADASLSYLQKKKVSVLPLTSFTCASS